MKMPAVLLLLFLGSMAGLSANDWPSWRGPNGDGKLPAATAYPTKWSATEKIAWRVNLPDRGNSSPVVSGDRVFLTQAEEEKLKAWHQKFLGSVDLPSGPRAALRDPPP